MASPTAAILLAHVREVGPYFHEWMKTLGDLRIVGGLRGTGLFACAERVTNPGIDRLVAILRQGIEMTREEFAKDGRLR